MGVEGPLGLGGDVSIGWCQALEEIGELVIQGLQISERPSLVLLLGPLSASILPFMFLPLMHNPWEGTQRSRRCTVLGETHHLWEAPQPLGRSPTP